MRHKKAAANTFDFPKKKKKKKVTTTIKMIVDDPESILSALLDWAKNSKLKDVNLADDVLNHDGLSLSASTKLSVTFEDKTCEYSAGSIYLQILDPLQALMKYRAACKKHNISDPVKASDKPIIVGFFPSPSPAVVEQEKPRSSKPADAQRKDKRKHKAPPSDASKKKSKAKPGEMVTTEQIFEHLNSVVDKRQGGESSIAQAITKALSADGFSIEENKEKFDAMKERTATILSNEIPVGNSSSILRANNPRKDLSRILDLVSETNQHKKKAPSVSPKKQKSYLKGQKPIIIVPKGMTAPITLVNAYEFLANRRFVPRDVMVKQAGRTPPLTTFTRQIKTGLTAGLCEYEIIDTPRKLGNKPKEWERVVAVIVLGQSWQFKDWSPGYNIPAKLFDKVYGFYISMEGDKLPKDVTGWAVKRATLNRDKRGLDSVAYASFWNGLDEWMKVYKSELLPQTEGE